MIAPLTKSDGKPLKKIKDISRDVYIIAHKEDTRKLESFFQNRGFAVRVFRRAYTAEEQGLPSQVRCLLNHQDAWQAIADSGRAGIVVEADFVPVRSFAEAESPFDPDISPVAIGWLYAGGPVIYGFDQRGYAIGSSSTAVALLIMPKAASALAQFAAKEMTDYRSEILLWDTYFCHHLRGLMNVPTYIPFKQLGDHGGIPNPDHNLHMARGWHQGDILLDRLAFMPLYAKGSLIRFLAIRSRAVLRGALRVFTGRFIEVPAFRSSRQKRLILWFTLTRWWPWTRSFAGFDAWR
jgi:hypothetical protein